MKFLRLANHISLFVSAPLPALSYTMMSTVRGIVESAKEMSLALNSQTNGRKQNLFGIVIIHYLPEKILLTSIISPVLHVSFQILSSHNKLQRHLGLFSRQEKFL